MSGFCGDAICATRVDVWLNDPDDPPADPCRQCRIALEEFFGLRPAPRLPTLARLARRLDCVAGFGCRAYEFDDEERVMPRRNQSPEQRRARRKRVASRARERALRDAPPRPARLPCQ